MNYNFFLEKKTAEDFLTKKSKEIFGKNIEVFIKKIKRSGTYNPEALNLLYDVNLGQEEYSIRISSSKVFSKEHDFNVFNYFYNNGFNKPPFIVPKPLVYLKEENILIYKNEEGSTLSDVLKRERQEIVEIIKNCAVLGKKIHSLKIPDFSLFNPELLFQNFQFDQIKQKFPNAKNFPLIIEEIKNKLINKNNQTFCHGDFNPNNLLISKRTICLIDFGLTTVFYKEIDLASFLTHMRILLEKNPVLFKELKNIFLSVYENYDENNLYLLMSLIDARLLEISVVFEKTNYNSEFIWECLKEDLELAKIKV